MSAHYPFTCGVVITLLQMLGPIVAQGQASPQDTHDHRLFPCAEDGLKSNDFGCQLLAKVEVTQFPDGGPIEQLHARVRVE